MLPLSIVIPTWKNLEYLDLAYKGIAKNSAAGHEVIVFFNEIDDACRDWAESRNIQYTGSDENLGVCAAVNRGVELATREFVCFMNDDMYPLPGWDTELERFAGEADKIWLSGTAVEAGKATECYIGGCDYGLTPSDFREEQLLADCESLRRPYNVVSTWTPIVLKKRDWDAVGGFDEEYFPGNGSDPDLAMKMYEYGCRHFIGVGSSLVYHFSRTSISRFDDADVMNPKKYFKKKWGTSWRRFLKRDLHRGEALTPELQAQISAK